MHTSQVSLVPAVTSPIRALKERFTLQGDPLPIEVCAIRMGLDVFAEPGSGFTELTQAGPDGGHHRTWILTDEGKWLFAKYPVSAESFDPKPVSEAQVLASMLKLYYRRGLYKQENQPDGPVLASLSARLVPLVSPEQLNTLRDQIKQIRLSR